MNRIQILGDFSADQALGWILDQEHRFRRDVVNVWIVRLGELYHRDAPTGHRVERVLGGALKNVLGCSCHAEPWTDVGQARFRVSFQRLRIKVQNDTMVNPV